jgi:hypothetical protein
MSETQVGTNTTSSSPFIAPGDVIYFQGTDNRLLKVNGDGSGFFQIGTNTTSSAPFVFTDQISGTWVYFRGTDDRLLKVRPDPIGSELQQIGGESTSSTPFVVADSSTGNAWVYFQDTIDRLMKIRSDGTGSIPIGNNETASSPFVLSDPIDGEWVYFQDKNNKLWKVRGDRNGSNLSQIGTNTTNSSPFVTYEATTGKVWVYFRGTDDKLWKVRNDPAGSELLWINHNRTLATPCVTEDGWVYFQGTHTGSPPTSPSKLWRVFNDGSHQSQPGGNFALSMPKVGAIQFDSVEAWRWLYFQQDPDNKLMRYRQVQTPLAIGQARPKFYVLTVLYAPPGTHDGQSGSLVDYGSTSTTGTKTSISSSFKAGLTLGFGIGPKDSQIGLQFGVSRTETDESSVEIAKSETFDVRISGPANDGIDHDHDVFVLLLNPLLQVAEFPGGDVRVVFSVDGPVMNIQYVYAGWLRDVTTMAPGVKQQLDAAGLDETDYQQILSTNPFASGPASIDPDRYLPLPESFAYEPPFSSGDAPWSETYKVDNTTTQTSTRTVDVTYTVTVTLPPILDSLLNIGGTLEWTNTNATETTDARTESATVTVGGPSFGYTGQTEILVYWDTVYHSFMFAFPSTDTGTAGKPRTRRRSRVTARP